ncbi:hypothetical protein [Dyadobacter luteus]|nr:hypothetical protein [Dyadobacter luteus]
MKSQKGKYNFEWKQGRLSWRASEYSVYFDTGKDFLFERRGTGKFAKVSKDELFGRHQ